MKNKLYTRVIAGTAKGTKLTNPKDITRPLTDRIKMSLFDLLKDYIPNSNIADLYAGGANFAIEALSRGAKHATIVDIAQESIRCINTNLDNSNLSDKAEVKQLHVEDFAKSRKKRFDIIFLDPPFREIVLEHIEDSAKLLKRKGLLIFRHPKQFISPNKLGKAKKILEKKYGKSIISFYYLE